METAIISEDQHTDNPAGIATRYDGKALISGVGGPLATALDVGGAVGEINREGGKICSKCGCFKEVAAFPRKYKGGNYRNTCCQECATKRGKEWRAKNRDHVNAHHRKYMLTYHKPMKEHHPRPEGKSPKYLREIWGRANKKRANTPKGLLSKSISSNMRHSIGSSKAGRHWEALVGYSVDQLKKHLEKRFQPGMTWENYGEWHVDHKIPVSVFNFEKPEDSDFKKCWALKNLQPLWKFDNISKNAKIDKPFQPSLKI